MITIMKARIFSYSLQVTRWHLVALAINICKVLKRKSYLILGPESRRANPKFKVSGGKLHSSVQNKTRNIDYSQT